MAIQSNDTKDYAVDGVKCHKCHKTAEQTIGLQYYFAFEFFVCNTCYPDVKAEYARTHF